MKKSTFSKLLPLLLIIFIDTLGTGLIFPLLSPLLLSPSTGIINHPLTIEQRNLLFGFVVSIYPLFMLVSSPILGDISDQLGRKSTLLICLLGTAMGYILSIAAILEHSILVFLLGRALSGATSGSMSIAQAAIVDLSHDDQERTANLGIMLLAVSLGFIIGPSLSAILTNQHWVSWFSLELPLYFAAGLTLINILLLILCFQDVYTIKSTAKIHWFTGLIRLTEGFKLINIRYLVITFLLLQLGWSSYLQSLSLFLTRRYYFDETQIGFYMAWLGIGFCIAFSYLLNKLIAHFTLHTIAISSLLIMFGTMLVIALIPSTWVTWLFAIPAACGLAISYSVLVSLLSQQVTAERQGWIMGLTGSISAASFGVAALLSGYLSNIAITMPIYFAAFALCLAAFFCQKDQKRVSVGS